MNDLFDRFLEGLAVSAPSVIAAGAILINNYAAYSRQKNDRIIKIKLDLIEKIYESYDEITKQFVDIFVSVEPTLYEIQDELLYNGSENKMHMYLSELYELNKKVLFLATYKRKAFEVYDIKIDADELAKDISGVLRKIQSYVKIIANVTKLFIVYYSETNDILIARKMVVDDLKSIRNQHLSPADIRDKTERFNMSFDCINESEKKRIGSEIKKIINDYVGDINEYDCKKLDEFESQIAEAIKVLVK